MNTQLRVILLDLAMLALTIGFCIPWTPYLSLRLAQRLANAKTPFDSASHFFHHIAFLQDAAWIRKQITEMEENIAENDFAEANTALSEIIQRYPEFRQQHELAQKIEAAQHDYQQAQAAAAKRAWELKDWKTANEHAARADQNDPFILYVQGYAAIQRKDYARAGNAFFRKAADLGNPDAMLELGKLYMRRQFTAPENEMENWLRQAIAAGRQEASLPLAEILRKGKRTEEAIECLRQATYRGCAKAASHLGDLYASGKDVPMDAAEAAKWHEIAANQGEKKSIKELAKLYEQPGTAITDLAVAAQWYERAAQAGDAEAQCKLGEMYAKGLGVTQDLQRAIAWYQTAAEHGSKTARQWLLDYEQQRQQTKRTAELAKQQQFAKKEQPRKNQPKDYGAIQLAIEKKNWDAAFELARRADQSNPTIQALLAEMYLNGLGNAPDAKRALQYAQKAASRGSLRGTYILAQCYLRQSLTHPDALQPLTVVAESRPSGELSPEEIAEAQTRLAHLHIFGKSEQCNPRIGVSYATTAMTGGSAEAAYLLGWVYLYGIGVSRDPVFAEAMLQWAHQRGYQKATTLLKKNNWLPNK